MTFLSWRLKRVRVTMVASATTQSYVEYWLFWMKQPSGDKWWQQPAQARQVPLLRLYVLRRRVSTCVKGTKWLGSILECLLRKGTEFGD